MPIRSNDCGSMNIYCNKLNKMFKMQFTLKNLRLKMKYHSEYAYLHLSLVEHMFPSKLCKNLPFAMFLQLNIVKCSMTQFIATLKIKTNKKSVLSSSLLFDPLVAINHAKIACFIDLYASTANVSILNNNMIISETSNPIV